MRFLLALLLLLLLLQSAAGAGAGGCEGGQQCTPREECPHYQDRLTQLRNTAHIHKASNMAPTLG